MRESIKILRASIGALHRNRWVFRSIDFHAGCLAGAAAVVVAHFDDDLVARVGRDLAIASIALGVAIVAVALTALAILATFMTETFAALLQGVHGGVRGTVMPYQAVATVAAAGVLAGGGALACGPLFSSWFLPVGFGVLVLIDVWMVVGTIQIVNITAAIAISRSDLYEGIAAARDKLRERRNEVG